MMAQELEGFPPVKGETPDIFSQAVVNLATKAPHSALKALNSEQPGADLRLTIEMLFKNSSNTTKIHKDMSHSIRSQTLKFQVSHTKPPANLVFMKAIIHTLKKKKIYKVD